MRLLAVMTLLMAGLIGPATANDYSLANRPELVFPGPKGGTVHVSPYPMSKRAASVWISDACWRDCEGQCAWSNEACLLGMRLGRRQVADEELGVGERAMGDDLRDRIGLAFGEAQHLPRHREALLDLGARGVMNPAPEQSRPLPPLVLETLA